MGRTLTHFTDSRVLIIFLVFIYLFIFAHTVTEKIMHILKRHQKKTLRSFKVNL